MKLADKIRFHVNDKYFQPIRKTGKIGYVKLRAGDIHDELNLVERAPAVCGALDAQKIQNEFNVKLVKRSGPKHGKNAYFQFQIFP